MSTQEDTRKRVLVLSHDVAGASMAGPGIRYAAIAHQLSRYFDTTLGLLNGTPDQQQELADTYGIPVEVFDEKHCEELFDQADYIFGQWLSDDMLYYARSRHKRIIFDLYSPVPIEFLLFRYFSSTGFSELERHEVEDTVERYKRYAATGDYFVCSNERQRDMWTGFFLAANVIQQRPGSYTDISSLIGIAPMGVPKTPPEHTQSVLRGVMEGIEKDDFLLLWTGGLWEWFDPLTVVQAIEKAHQHNPRIKLVFMGYTHPNKNVPRMSEAQKTFDYIKEHGLENTCVFFVDEWIAHEERTNYLLEADAAVYAHKQSLETRFSHRSRVLDHIYAGLPTIATPGDYISDNLITDKNLGVVAENSVAGISHTVQDLAANPEMQARIKNSIAEISPEFLWEKTVQDLIEFIRVNKPGSSINFSTTSDKVSHTRSRYYVRRIIRKLKQHVH